MNTTTYLDRFLDPVAAAFTPELAQTIANIKADAELQARIEYLSSGANHGTLTADEKAEYQEFVEAADVFAIIQSKARKFLADHAV